MRQLQSVKILCNEQSKEIALFSLLFEFLHSKPFISCREKKSTSFIPVKWKQTTFLVSCLLTGKSVSCWRWKDRENRTISPSLLLVSSALHSHTMTLIAYMGGVLCDFTVLERKSWVLLFKAFKCIVPAASTHGQWFSLLLNCAAEWDQLEATAWIGPCQYIWGES